MFALFIAVVVISVIVLGYSFFGQEIEITFDPYEAREQKRKLREQQ